MIYTTIQSFYDEVSYYEAQIYIYKETKIIAQIYLQNVFVNIVIRNSDTNRWILFFLIEDEEGQIN